MKKILTVFVIAILHMLPLSVLAQRRAGPQTKVGKYLVDVAYDGVSDYESTAPGNGKSHNARYTAKTHIGYQVSQLEKAIRHDNTTSLVEPSEPSGSGSFSYTLTGEEHNVSSDDLHYDSTEQASFHGTISKAGAVGAEFPDTGDEITSAGVSASGDGSGSYKKIVNREEWAYNGQTGKNDKKIMPPETDTLCNAGSDLGPVPIHIKSADPDTTRPPESACSVDLTYGANVMVRPLTAEELNHQGAWGGGAFVGSWASGKYKLSLTATHRPADYQQTDTTEKRSFAETLSFTLTLNLAGAAASLGARPDLPDLAMIAEAPTLEDELHYFA